MSEKQPEDDSIREFSKESLEEFGTAKLTAEKLRESSSGEKRTIRKSPTPRTGLRRRVFLILLLFATIPSYLILILSYFTASSSLIGEIRQDASSSTQRIAFEIDRIIGEYGREVHGLAAQDSIIRSLQSSDPQLDFVEQLPFELASQQLDFPVDTIFFIHRRDGTLESELFGNSFGWQSAPWGREGLEGLLAGHFQDMREDADHYCIETVTSVPVLRELLMISTPLTVPGAEDLYLCSVIHIDGIFDEASGLSVPPERDIYLVSGRLGMIYSNQRDRSSDGAISKVRDSLQTKEMESRAWFQIGNSDQDRLAASSQRVRTAMFSNTNPELSATWDIVEIVNLDDTLVALNKLYWTLMLIGVVTSLAAFVFSIFLSKNLVLPIQEITIGMGRFARGELDYKVEVDTRDELESLAEAANVMAKSLSSSYENLANRMLELDEKANQLSLIYSISRSINQSLDLDLLFECIVRELRSIISSDRISMALYDNDRDSLTMDYVFPNSRSVLPRQMAIPIDSSIMGHALRKEKITLKTLREDGKYFEEIHLWPVGIRRICIVPLITKNGVIGTLNLGSHEENSYHMSEIKLLERVAETLGLAVEHGRLYQRVAAFAEQLEETVEARTKELKTAQQRLVQTEKFAATGSIAAHIGHELNNPLSIIKNYLKISSGRLINEKPTGADLRETRDGLKVIDEEIDRIARIVSQLRQVSKPAQSQPIRFPLHDELDKLIELFQATMKKRGISFRTDYRDDLEEVVLALDSLRQILINLIRNSIDALEEKGDGEISLQTRWKDSEKKIFEIIVSDTGPGIPKENLNSIFDPFFTTKTAGKGTGLGLSVSYSLAQGMGGTMSVKSAPGQGTRITIALPVEFKPADPDSSGDPSRTSTSDTGIGSPFKRRNRKIMIG